MKQKKSPSSGGAIAAVTPNAALAPVVCPRDMTDPIIIDQRRVFGEAIRQTQPIATSGSPEAAQAAKEVGNGTARLRGLHPATCKRQVTEGMELDNFFSGPNPSGKAAEVVAAADYIDMHEGNDPGIINSPNKVADNLEDIRLSPDSASRKDLIFSFRTKDGMVIFKPNGQVKTGGSQYVADTLVKMAETPGYGKVGYVDARYVNSDGTPRIAPDGFTNAQARRLQRAKVRLRGIKDLETRAEDLVKNMEKYREDGLEPVAREQLRQLRDDIARAYQPGKIATRLVGGAATAAATAAVLTLVLQLATEGKIELSAVGDSAKTGALYGGGSVLADAGIYHVATLLGKTPEVAKSYAQNGVAAGFCLFAVGVDVLSEIKSVRDGEVTTANALAGTAVKVALDVLPFATAPLGLAGIPVVVGAQVGGRWIVNRVREADKQIEMAIEEDLRGCAQLHTRLDRIGQVSAATCRECDETDALFDEIFGFERSAQLRVIK